MLEQTKEESKMVLTSQMSMHEEEKSCVEADRVVFCISKVFLMTGDDRYAPFSLQLTSKKLLLITSQSMANIEHELLKVQVNTPDSQGVKALDKSGKFHAIQITSDDKRNRKVYFTCFAEMM